MIRKDKEIILKLDEEHFARLTACLFTSLMISKDNEVRDDLRDLIHTIVTQLSE